MSKLYELIAFRLEMFFAFASNESDLVSLPAGFKNQKVQSALPPSVRRP